MIRIAIFLLGCALMFLSLFVPFVVAENAGWSRFRMWELGALLAIGAHGWPENLH